MSNMSNVVIVQLAAVAVIGILLAWVLYEVLRIRAESTAQRTALLRAMAIIKNVQQLEPQLISLLQRLDSVRIAGETQQARLSEIMDGLAHNILEAGRKQQNDLAVMRKETLSQDPKLRFTILKDWIAKNFLAILRRAGHEWKSADDLIAMIPSTLEPEAEILDRVLLVSTRGYFDKVEIVIRDRDPASGDVVSIAVRQQDARFRS